MVLVSLRKIGLIGLLVVLYGGLLTGCGVEIARASIQQVGHYELSFEHNSLAVRLWTDLDVEYIDETTIWYEIRISQNGDLISDLICNPFDHGAKLMARRAEVRGVTKESFLAPMNCEVGDLPKGEIQLDIDLYAEGGGIRIFRADLVVNERE